MEIKIPHNMTSQILALKDKHHIQGTASWFILSLLERGRLDLELDLAVESQSENNETK